MCIRDRYQRRVHGDSYKIIRLMQAKIFFVTLSIAVLAASKPDCSPAGVKSTYRLFISELEHLNVRQAYDLRQQVSDFPRDLAIRGCKLSQFKQCTEEQALILKEAGTASLHLLKKLFSSYLTTCLDGATEETAVVLLKASPCSGILDQLMKRVTDIQQNFADHQKALKQLRDSKYLIENYAQCRRDQHTISERCFSLIGDLRLDFVRVTFERTIQELRQRIELFLLPEFKSIINACENQGDQASG
eukprot:TRINITY_DN4873_c0_g1_i1.p1 TRINITY_DN4873_c0_g1~~TRINITY_DN4873_c0_g1_i1.p1  ORF type:complete len:246 (-),score=75.92 TRINITY_DN4873_c0_g1_i1:278-1015(-)